MVSWTFAAVTIIDEHLKIKLYILPDEVQTIEQGLPCDLYHFSNTSSCYMYNLSTMTLNEFLQVNQDHVILDDTYFYEIVFTSGIHVINISHDQ